MTTGSSNMCQPIERGDDAGLSMQRNGRYTKMDNAVYCPALDVYALNDRYEIHIDLPGASADQIQATIANGVLMIEAAVPGRFPEGASSVYSEYGVGDFRRQIRLGEDVDSERLTAKYDHGVLTIVVPKLAQRRFRRVPVTAG